MSKILVVDDQFADRELCRDILEDAGFEVDTAEGGREALEILEKKQYDVVLSDLNMPEVDGIALVKGVKERKWNTEVIIMTAYGTIQAAVEAIKLGAFDFLIKPIDKHKIASLVKRSVEFRDLNKEVVKLRENASLLEAKIREKTEQVVETNKKMFALEKMKILGELSGGVAHQLRNPLHIILSTVQYSIEKFKLNGELYDCMNTVINTVINAEKIVKDLLRTTHFDNLNMETMPLQSVLDQTLLLIETKCKNQHITVTKSYGPYDVLVKADYSYLQQCLLNIVINACEVMPNGGSLDVGYTLPGEKVNIVVKDSGPGIPEDVIGKLFTPFYTTKSNGTGLGLYFVYEVFTKQFDGDIKIENTSGGVTVTMTLPIQKE